MHLAEREPRVGLHGPHEVGHLKRQRFQRRAHDVGAVGAAREAEDRAARLRVPIRRAQARERGDHVDARGVGDRARQLLALGDRRDEPQLVAQPLHERARHEHAPLKRVHRPLAGGGGGDGRHEAVRRGAGLAAGVEQKEAAGAVGVLGLARPEAALSEQRRLLVARNAADGDARQHPGACRHAEIARRGANLGQHRGGDAEQVQQPGIPAHLMDVEEHRAACVGDVGGVDGAVRERPDEPRVDGSEGQLAGLGVLARAGHVVQDPLDLAGREVRIGHQTRLLRDGLRHLGIRRQQIDDVGRATALPHDGVAHRLARLAVPHHGGLALVGDADAVDVGGAQPVLHQKLGERAQLRGQDVARIMLDPARLGEDLREGVLHRIDDAPLAVDQHRTRGGGSLVERYDIGSGHVSFLSRKAPARCGAVARCGLRATRARRP